MLLVSAPPPTLGAILNEDPFALASYGFLCIAVYLCFNRMGPLKLPSLWEPIFFSFLPICFVFVAINNSQMQREIDRLRQQISGQREPGAASTTTPG